MSKPKKKFAESTVGKLLFGAASIVNPTLGNVLKGVTSPGEAIAAIGKSDVSADDKIEHYLEGFLEGDWQIDPYWDEAEGKEE